MMELIPKQSQCQKKADQRDVEFMLENKCRPAILAAPL
jgi:hypothetical protein